MRDEFKILMILVCTFCFSILVGMIGVMFGKVDAQFVEGLITGGLLTLITMLFKDILNNPNNAGQTSVTTLTQTTPTEEVKK